MEGILFRNEKIFFNIAQTSLRGERVYYNGEVKLIDYVKPGGQDEYETDAAQPYQTGTKYLISDYSPSPLKCTLFDIIADVFQWLPSIGYEDSGRDEALEMYLIDIFPEITGYEEVRNHWEGCTQD